MDNFIFPLSGIRKEAAAWQKLWKTVGRPAAAEYLRKVRATTPFWMRKSPLSAVQARQVGLMKGVGATNEAYRNRLLKAVDKINANREKRAIQAHGKAQKAFYKNPSREAGEAIDSAARIDPEKFKLKPFVNQDEAWARKITGGPEAYPAEDILRDKEVWEDLSSFGRAYPKLRGMITVPESSPILPKVPYYKIPR